MPATYIHSWSDKKSSSVATETPQDVRQAEATNGEVDAFSNARHAGGTVGTAVSPVQS